MLSSMTSCCNDCLLWVQPSSLRKPFVNQKSDANRIPYTAGSSVGLAGACHAEEDTEEEEAHQSSRSAPKATARSRGSEEKNEDPFKNVSGNRLSRQSVRARRKSSSDTDTSSLMTASMSSVGSLDAPHGSVPRARLSGEPRKEKRHVPGGPRPPPVRTVTVVQQPKSEDIFRPDLADPKQTTKAPVPMHQQDRARQKQGAQRSPSVASSLNSTKTYRKTQPARFISPQEAAAVAVDNQRPSTDCPQATDGPASANHVSQWLSSSLAEKKSLATDAVEPAEAATEKGSFGRLLGLVAGNQASAHARHQYTSTGGAWSKVNPRSLTTVQSIGTKKASLQSQVIAQYTFGFIHIAYKFSKEKKLEVDILKVTKVPRYEASMFERDAHGDVNMPSLKYVDIEVCLRLSKGKELVHKVKKFRSGDDDTDNLPFEPECCFRHKDLEDSVLVLSVNRRQKHLITPSQSLGHGLLKFPREDVQQPIIVRKTLPLKHGTQRQDVKGSLLLVLTCKHAVAKTTELCLEVRLVQYVDVAALGVSPNVPDFKVKPEIKIRTQLVGSEKSGASRSRDFPWICLQNNTQLSRRQEEGAGDFGGWGTLFSEGCSTSRVVLDSELQAFTLSFVVQVYGRNNVGPAARKEVLLGTVVLGPELKCSPDFSSSVEEGSLTHWGEAITKRTAVERLHRLHL